MDGELALKENPPACARTRAFILLVCGRRCTTAGTRLRSRSRILLLPLRNPSRQRRRRTPRLRHQPPRFRLHRTQLLHPHACTQLICEPGGTRARSSASPRTLERVPCTRDHCLHAPPRRHDALEPGNPSAHAIDEPAHAREKRGLCLHEGADFRDERGGRGGRGRRRRRGREGGRDGFRCGCG
ncbi:hypothetical protein B0H13DRAFT_2034053 [Mycena leptocephala]|nr:hypothetical protein B0H13DRAFT_2034053 [Mycena leptocephala]